MRFVSALVITPTLLQSVSVLTIDLSQLKLAFHDADTDTDILARILADASNTSDWPAAS